MPTYLEMCRNVTGGHCSIDVNECSSQPCENGATCKESFSDKSVMPNVFSCLCGPGFANGLCDYDYIPEYKSVCSIQAAGRCDIDVDECTSIPCANNAVCWESNSNESVPVHAYTCICRAGFANGWCEGMQLAGYSELCAVQLGGHCDIDIDECSSNPCKNGATCTAAAASFDSYVCTCAAGFANGMCHYLYVLSYAVQCSLVSGGACDVDVNECDSTPCQNGATCEESSTPHTSSSQTVAPHAYRCTCGAGFVNGKCGYDHVQEYEAMCTIMESDPLAQLTDGVGNCDVDANECASHPCRNGATCSDSTTVSGVSAHAYRCSCSPGFASGMCGYAFIAEYASECTIAESTSAQYAGNCDINIDECASTPCMNGARCLDPGVDSFICHCVPGYDGYVCAIDVAECASEPCLNGGTCLDFGLGPDRFECECPPGFTGPNCDIDVDECASMPCQHPAPCTDGVNFFSCGTPLELQLVLALDLTDWNPSFAAILQTEVSDRLGVHVSRVQIATVGTGSVVINIWILPAQSEDQVGLEEAGALFAQTFVGDSAMVGGVPVLSIDIVHGAAAVGCPAGFKGADCSLDINECSSRPCAHLGSCVDHAASYTCRCQIGWTGHNCDRALTLDSDFGVLLSTTAIATIASAATVGPILTYALMTRVNFDFHMERFSYSLHAISSTMAVASAAIGTVTFVSFVRPAAAGMLIYFQTMAPRGESSQASFAVPCPILCSSNGMVGCQCPRGYEVESASGRLLCTTDSVQCTNNTYQLCGAVTGDSSTADSLSVDPYDSCEGPCAQIERSRRTVTVLLGFCLAAVSLEWASVVANCCTHLHRLPMCVPRWEWMFPPVFLVHAVLQLICTVLEVYVAVMVAGSAAELATLLAVDCFEEPTVFALETVERHLGMAWGACMTNLAMSCVNLLAIVAGILLARTSAPRSSGYLDRSPARDKDSQVSHLTRSILPFSPELYSGAIQV